MLRVVFTFLITILVSCGPVNTNEPQNSTGKPTPAKIKEDYDEYTLKTRFNAFDTTVDVIFSDTKDSISDLQRMNYEGFIKKQDSFMPFIMKAIFEFYKSSYADYKKGWTMDGGISSKELEKYLPTPTTPGNLKPFITPGTIYIQKKSNCNEGTLGIEFDCTWDIENGLGVSIRNWKVIEASVAEIAYVGDDH